MLGVATHLCIFTPTPLTSSRPVGSRQRWFDGKPDCGSDGQQRCSSHGTGGGEAGPALLCHTQLQLWLLLLPRLTPDLPPTRLHFLQAAKEAKKLDKPKELEKLENGKKPKKLEKHKKHDDKHEKRKKRAKHEKPTNPMELPLQVGTGQKSCHVLCVLCILHDCGQQLTVLMTHCLLPLDAGQAPPHCGQEGRHSRNPQSAGAGCTYQFQGHFWREG